MNIDEQKKYVFKKTYTSERGTLPEGTEITLFRNQVFVNGGMCTPFYRNLFMDLLSKPEFIKEYLREIKISYNKK